MPRRMVDTYLISNATHGFVSPRFADFQYAALGLTIGEVSIAKRSTTAVQWEEASPWLSHHQNGPATDGSSFA